MRNSDGGGARTHPALAWAAGLAAVAIPAWGHAQTIELGAVMTGAGEAPPIATPAAGMAFATIDTATLTLNWLVAFSGLSGPPTAAHFHGPAMVGVNAGVMVPIAGGDAASPITGSAQITPQQMADLLGGLWYANVHTVLNPPGELRGQMMPRDIFGAEPTAPGGDEPACTAYLIADAGSFALDWFVACPGLSAPPAAAELRSPAPDSVVALDASTNPMTGSATLTAQQFAALSAGEWTLSVQPADGQAIAAPVLPFRF